MSNENWYKIGNSKTPVNQGDIFFKCPIVKPNYTKRVGSIPSKVNAIIDEYNVIVLSQSCDLLNNKLDIVLVSPIFTLTRFSQFDVTFLGKKKREKLRQGDYPAYHMLNNPLKDGFPNDFFVADFHSVFGVPFTLLNDLRETQKKRLTLLSPYKEHLSQSFARYFMRVGLPSTIPSFK